MENQTVSFFRWIIITTCIPYFGILPMMPAHILGFSLRGWAWIIILIVSIFVLLKQKQVTMPVTIWVPFILYILFYNFFDLSFIGVQLSLQYIVSIFVGFAASSLVYNEEVEQRLYKLFKSFILLFLLFCIVTLAIFRSTPYAAATVMTLTVFATLFLCNYFINRRWVGIWGYLTCLAFPIFMVTRMAALAMLLVSVAHFANQSFFKKGVVLAVVLFLGSSVFYSSSFQEKSFGTRHGDYEDVNMENQKFNSSGRKYLYDELKGGLAAAPIWGNGPRADLKLMEKRGLYVKEVHNDYLAVRYNYGYVGLGLVLMALLIQAFLLYRKRKKIEDDFTFWMYASSMTLFLPLFALMYTDNILKYSIFFGNYHFAMIGIVYSKIFHLERAVNNEMN